MSDLEYAAAVRKLWEWQNGQTHFTAQLYTLISKADPGNMVKLKSAFPIEVQVYKDWQQSPDEHEFFEEALF